MAHEVKESHAYDLANKDFIKVIPWYTLAGTGVTGQFGNCTPEISEL
jgi:hypothetical protein